MINLLILLHAGFLLFVAFGGLLVLRWRRLAWLHLPAVFWGCFVEAADRLCPLTFLENYFRRSGGGTGYGGDFVTHYLGPLLYPQVLGRDLQVALAVFVVMINMIVYAFYFRERGEP